MKRWHPDCPLRWYQRHPTLSALLYAVALALTWNVMVAHAEDVTPPAEIILSLDDYATLVGLAGQVKPLQAERDALERSLGNMTEQRDLLTERVRLKTAIADDYRELAEIRKARAEEAEARGDRIAKEKRAAGFFATVEKRASQGALAGAIAGGVPTLQFGGLGAIPMAILGGGLGALYGALEAWAQGP